jgi:tRNA modification GTPase
VEYQPPHRGRRPHEALSDDTIAAVATPPGRGGIAIVRISGPDAPRIAQGLLGRLPTPRTATRLPFLDAQQRAIDRGLVCYFPAPHSYTGEPVLELHAHGSPVIAEALVSRAVQLGARRAQPGEFTQRAYLNAKLDLAQAEAVADLIDASSVQAARAALRSLEGEFSRQVLALSETLSEVRTYVEAAIDFADEAIDVLSNTALAARLSSAAGQLQALQSAGRRGRVLTQGLTLVIAGPPNAGKSTLLNRLAGHEAAIVTPTPGTTRDVLRERILLDGLPLQVLDTAGLRAAADEIEAEGIRRARTAMSGADRILFVVDASHDAQASAYRAERAQLPSSVPVTLILNKVDRVGGPLSAPAAAGDADEVVAVSALTGEGIDRLVAHLRHAAGLTGGTDTDVLSARARHLEALGQVEAALREANRQLAGGSTPELVAEELRQAQQLLGQIVGEQSSDELLGRIFSSFCIGK